MSNRSLVDALDRRLGASQGRHGMLGPWGGRVGALARRLGPAAQLGRLDHPSRGLAGRPTAATAPAASAGIILETDLAEEAESSYLSYAMSVIVGRALPDARDGLKPVHRRILFAMHELGMRPDRPHRKCARVVGEVLGKYHPHGDTAVYDALVRLAQPFSQRVTLVDGHGNFGSLDDDPPAAMRYTECRLDRYAHEALLGDLSGGDGLAGGLGGVASPALRGTGEGAEDIAPPEVETFAPSSGASGSIVSVDTAPNFDSSAREPVVLPARVPNLLVNGAVGIAVGIATRVPPHNLGEVVEALREVIRDREAPLDHLMAALPAPDFPTGGIVVRSQGLTDAYALGRGAIEIVARMHLENAEEAEEAGEGAAAPDRAAGAAGRRRRRGSASPPTLVLSELPFGTNKSSLVQQISRLVDAGSLQGIRDVRDESDREGLRVAVELAPGADPATVRAELLARTAAGARFSANVVALVGGVPRTLGLREALLAFLDARVEVVRRRAEHDLEVCTKRAHVLEGLAAVMARTDEAVVAIRSAADGAEAGRNLRALLGLSEAQAEAVLALPLRRLTTLEGGRVESERAALSVRVGGLERLLASHDLVLGAVEREAIEVARKFGSPRRTQVVHPSAVWDGRGLVEPRRDGGQVEPWTPPRPDEVLGASPSATLGPSASPPSPSGPSHPTTHVLVRSSAGYLKRTPLGPVAPQARGGKGARLAGLRPDDTIAGADPLAVSDLVLCLTSAGRAHTLPAAAIPSQGRVTVGTPTSHLFPGAKSSIAVAVVLQELLVGRLASAVPSRPAHGGGDRGGAAEPNAGTPSLLILTRHGKAIRVRLADVVSASRKAGLPALAVEEGDEVVWAGVCGEADSAVVCSSGGALLHVPVEIVRLTGRGGIGVGIMPGAEIAGAAIVPGGAEGVALGVERDAAELENDTDDEAEVEAARAGAQDGADASDGDLPDLDPREDDAPLVPPGPSVLLASRSGLAKRVPLSALQVRRGRARQGTKVLGLAQGDALAAVAYVPDFRGKGIGSGEPVRAPNVLLATTHGMAVRVPVDEVALLGRTARGARLVRLADGDHVASLSLVDAR